MNCLEKKKSELPCKLNEKRIVDEHTARYEFNGVCYNVKIMAVTPGDGTRGFKNCLVMNKNIMYKRIWLRTCFRFIEPIYTNSTLKICKPIGAR